MRVAWNKSLKEDINRRRERKYRLFQEACMKIRVVLGNEYRQLILLGSYCT